MPNYTTADIRNLALVGHGGSGKTSLVEAMLHEAGAIHHVGLVEKGTTVSDFTEEEKTRGHSIYATITHADYQGKHLNIIDTPGYPDFVGQPIQIMPAVETVVIVISAAAGIEPNVRRMWERATAQKYCRAIIINKIDHENIDLPLLLARVQEQMGPMCVPINLPANKSSAVVDCFFNAAGDSDLGSVADAHKAIIERAVEVDEKLMEKYLQDDQSIKPEDLLQPFQQAMRQGNLVPILFTCARRSDDPTKVVGVKEVLEFLVKLAPNPLQGNPQGFYKSDAKDTTITFDGDAKKHVVAQVFNVAVDPFVGKLSAFRVHQGTLTTHTMLFITDKRGGEVKKPFKVSHLFKYQGKDHLEVSDAIPGDIVAVAKVDDIHRGAVLHDHKDQEDLHHNEPALPAPMYGLAVSAKTRGDEQKISESLAKVVEEDPAFKVVRDASTHETVVYGVGELHLRMVLDRFKSRFKLDVDTKPPKIAYRESITVKADGHHRHKKQTGGAGQFGEVYLHVIPLPRGSGFEFVDATVGGKPPRQYLPAVEKGVRLVLETGAIAGYPLQDVRVEIYDGKHHDVDSKEIAFVTAGKRAFIDGVSKARPAILEPMVSMEITVPAAHMGDIAGDISGKRGRVLGTDMLGDMAVIKAVVPLAEVTNYQNQLKSVTGGQGSYTMEFSHYDPVPGNVQAQIVAAYKPAATED